MNTEELINLLKTPLALSNDTIVSSLSGGTINHSYYINDDPNEFLLKHFQGEDSLAIDRQERFDLQLQLSKIWLAPKPMYLSSDRAIYAEQWVKQCQELELLSFENSHINELAIALTRIHHVEIKTKTVNLAKDWQSYLLSIPNPSSILVEQVAKLSMQWILSDEDSASCHVFCHNDLAWAHLCLPTEIILDWEYAAIGNRYFDILSCARVNGLDSKQQDHLLVKYAELNKISIDDVYKGCGKQASFLELTYQLWHEAVGLEPEI
ncbi:MAG: thiamine kinase-like enzyme [Glaciecola sp.]